MPYLTPDEVPEGTVCRPLFIPDDTAWLSLVSGILTEGTKFWNWEKFGTLTVQECVDVMQGIVDAYYDGGCSSCTLPGGYPILRVSVTGLVEEFNGSDFVEPYGDYEIPPLEPRTEPTEEERKCLAAKNAANVLQQLYEEVSDKVQEGLNVAEIALALVTLIATIINPVAGLITNAIFRFSLVSVGFVIEAVQYVSDDTWDSSFNEPLICLLINSATDTGGVITFDYDLFVEGLYAMTNWTDPTVFQQRLAGQIVFLLQWIGVEGLNAAGGTTAITDDDCTFCDEGWCYTWDFTVNDGGWVVDTYGEYVAGEGWMLTNVGVSAILIQYYFLFPTQFNSCVIETSNSGGEGGSALFTNTGSYTPVTVGRPLHSGNETRDMMEGATSITMSNLVWNANCDVGATVYLRRMTISNPTGVNPVGEDNC